MKKITIIGSGNVGYHLGLRLKETGCSIMQMFSRQTEKSVRAARIVGAMPIDNIASLQVGADLYIIAVKDDAIASVAEKMRKRIPGNAWVAHTSGSASSEILAPYFHNHGVFYPLQSFSIGRMVDFTNIPILIYASKLPMLERLRGIAESVSTKVYRIDDEQRAKLHVTAVMVNNFSNHLFAIADDILQREGLPMEILLPLIQETVRKIQCSPPHEMQTGPAIRNDQNTIRRHLAFLENYPEYREVYKTLTDSIIRMGDAGSQS